MEYLEKALQNIYEAEKTINSAPVGFVISCDDFNELKEQAIYGRKNIGDDISRLYDIPVYPFPDIPKGEMLAFKDSEKLNKYLDHRDEGKNHMQAFTDTMLDKPMFFEPDY